MWLKSCVTTTAKANSSQIWEAGPMDCNKSFNHCSYWSFAVVQCCNDVWNRVLETRQMSGGADVGGTKQRWSICLCDFITGRVVSLDSTDALLDGQSKLRGGGLGGGIGHGCDSGSFTGRLGPRPKNGGGSPPTCKERIGVLGLTGLSSGSVQFTEAFFMLGPKWSITWWPI